MGIAYQSHGRRMRGEVRQRSVRSRRKVTKRIAVIVAAALVAILVGGCGQNLWENMVTGTFDGGKPIGLNWVLGTMTYQGAIALYAYADVPEQTVGTLDINGPQHWRCTGAFRAPSYVPPSGDATKDKVFTLPSLEMGFEGPTGTYRVTIEVPSGFSEFSHTWRWFDWFAPESASGARNLYRNNGAPDRPVCTQVVNSLLLQQSLADQYLSRLQGMLEYPYWDIVATFPPPPPSPLRTQFQGLLDQAKQAKISGDGRFDPAARSADYLAAAAILRKMAQTARDVVVPPNPPWDLAPATQTNIIELATEAAALLSIPGLS